MVRDRDEMTETPKRMALEDIPGDITVESCGCPLGCPRDDEFIFEGFDRLHSLPGRYPVVRCRQCGLMRADPRPSRDSIGFYYPDYYSPHQATEGVQRRQPAWRAFLSRLFDYRTTAIPVLHPGRLLEVGCGSGTFLRAMARQGWHVEGIEPSSTAAESARAGGLAVFNGGIDDAPDPAVGYDLIVGWMVLEHLHDPVAALRKLASWAAPGGLLVLSVPNAGSLEARMFRDAWYAADVPRHLFQFDSRTLARVLTEGGWKPERVFHQRILTSLLASVGYRLGEWGVAPALSRKLVALPDAPGRHNQWFYPAALILSFLGQTGRMTVWARPGASNGKP